MARSGGFFFRMDKPLEETIKEFINEKSDRNQREFMQDNILLALIAMDKEFFLKKYAEKMEEHHEHNKRLRVLLKLAELLDFYDEKNDVFLSATGSKVHLEQLLAKGYFIDDGKLYIGPFK